MEDIWILILVLFLATNSLEKAESVKVKLEETPLKTFDEIFGEGWWGKDEAEDLKMPAPTNFGQIVHHQIDRQNTQLGQIEPNSTDQNPPLTESNHSDNAKNGDERNEIMEEITSNKNIAEDKRRRKIIDKFHAMKDKFKQKGKYSKKEWNQIEKEIAEHLKVSRTKIFKWKNFFGLSQKMNNIEKKKNERKNLVEKFDQRKAELKQAGLKNSYHSQINETVAKELGLSFVTIYKWKQKLGQTNPNKYPHNQQKELIKRYYEIKDQTPKISDEKITKRLKSGRTTLSAGRDEYTQRSMGRAPRTFVSTRSGICSVAVTFQNPISGYPPIYSGYIKNTGQITWTMKSSKL